MYEGRDPRLDEVLKAPQYGKPAKLIQMDGQFRVQNSTDKNQFGSKPQFDTAIILTVDKLSSLFANLALHNSTMADNNNNPPPPEAIQAPTQPPAAFYNLPDNVTTTMRVANYRAGNGIGVFLAPVPTTANVLATPVGDAAKMNEPTNRYAVKCLSLVIADMRHRTDNRPARDDDDDEGTPNRGGINRVGERQSVNTVMVRQAEELITLGNYEPEVLTQRRLTVYWNLMSGFNSDDDNNEALDMVLFHFCRVRLGDLNKDCDEFSAAVWAVKSYYNDTIADSVDQGKGMWTLPAVHLLNGHMIHRGMTPIAFHQDAEQDEQVALTERAANSVTIWLNGEQCKIESREAVRNELLTFLHEEMGMDWEIPDDEGPPSDDDSNDGAPPAQRRRVLHLG